MMSSIVLTLCGHSHKESFCHLLQEITYFIISGLTPPPLLLPSSLHVIIAVGFQDLRVA